MLHLESQMRLREGTARRRPGRYEEDSRPTEAERPVFLRDDVGFNEELTGHCAFPSLPMTYPGPGPSEIWKEQVIKEGPTRRHPGVLVILCGGSSDGDDSDGDSDGNESDSASSSASSSSYQTAPEQTERLILNVLGISMQRTESPTPGSHSQDGPLQEPADTGTAQTDEDGDTVTALGSGAGQHPTRVVARIITRPRSPAQCAPPKPNDNRALQKPRIVSISGRPSLPGTVEDTGQQGRRVSSPTLEGLAIDESFKLRALSRSQPNWPELSNGIKYITIYELTRSDYEETRSPMSFTRATRQLGLVFEEISDLIDLVDSERNKAEDFEDDVLEYIDSIDVSWIDDFLSRPRPSRVIDTITSKDIGRGKAFLTFMGLNSVAAKLGYYSGTAGAEAYDIPLNHLEEDGVRCLVPHFNVSCGTRIMEVHRKFTEQAKKKPRTMSSERLAMEDLGAAESPSATPTQAGPETPMDIDLEPLDGQPRVVEDRIKENDNSQQGNPGPALANSTLREESRAPPLGSPAPETSVPPQRKSPSPDFERILAAKPPPLQQRSVQLVEITNNYLDKYKDLIKDSAKSAFRGRFGSEAPSLRSNSEAPSLFPPKARKVTFREDRDDDDYVEGAGEVMGRTPKKSNARKRTQPSSQAEKSDTPAVKKIQKAQSNKQAALAQSRRAAREPLRGSGPSRKSRDASKLAEETQQRERPKKNPVADNDDDAPENIPALDSITVTSQTVAVAVTKTITRKSTEATNQHKDAPPAFGIVSRPVDPGLADRIQTEIRQGESVQDFFCREKFQPIQDAIATVSPSQNSGSQDQMEQPHPASSIPDVVGVISGDLNQYHPGPQNQRKRRKGKDDDQHQQHQDSGSEVTNPALKKPRGPRGPYKKKEKKQEQQQNQETTMEVSKPAPEKPHGNPQKKTTVLTVEGVELLHPSDGSQQAPTNTQAGHQKADSSMPTTPSKTIKTGVKAPLQNMGVDDDQEGFDDGREDVDEEQPTPSKTTKTGGKPPLQNWRLDDGQEDVDEDQPGHSVVGAEEIQLLPRDLPATAAQPVLFQNYTTTGGKQELFYSYNGKDADVPKGLSSLKEGPFEGAARLPHLQTELAYRKSTPRGYVAPSHGVGRFESGEEVDGVDADADAHADTDADNDISAGADTDARADADSGSEYDAEADEDEDAEGDSDIDIDVDADADAEDLDEVDTLQWSDSNDYDPASGDTLARRLRITGSWKAKEVSAARAHSFSPPSLSFLRRQKAENRAGKTES
ncbi:hypothetical protein B0T24DRAFT_667437 [Lasiosphaeria ovina]|uniref:Uncharacterized protein n=1 Tax=Lasiosphaeria ovina TaxID=92902 RepID=A0AAE0N866_9PEZI|nr:hypothetical protein B0T24DRAFT_667437 [Lasiosphaeria ovina]